MRFVCCGIALVLTIAAAKPARADDIVDACLSSHQDGQQQARDGHVRNARAAFARCAIDSCPSLVRNDCRTRGQAAAAAVASVRLLVQDDAGAEVEGASVAIDGAPAAPLSDDSLELDPGHHSARFRAQNGRSVAVDFELGPGQRDVAVRGVLSKQESARPEPPASATSSSVPAGTWAFGALALAGVGGFTLWGLAGKSAQHDLNACKPRCTDHGRYDAMKRDYILADVSLGVGVVGAALATYFYVARDKHTGEKPPAARLDAVPLQRGLALGLGRDF